jgi:anti-sigma-K factor RskA
VAVLWAEDLPPLPASQSYQLWLIYADGTRDSGAVFSVPADGSATVVVVAPKPFSAYARFGISVEPAGGSPAPTGPAALAS